MKSQQVRSKFLNFFKEKQHRIVSSSPIITKDDPTLMFINSGMAPFKDYFTSVSKPPSNRMANSQKCLRVSGKHNDLDDVGYDSYHHTFFEMLGNWSFGDYFKEEAIKWAWALLTEIYKINKDNLYVTVFEGDKQDKVKMDLDAYNIWKELLPEERIIRDNKKNNFWEMGDQGPCGPSSEIHIDIRSESEKKELPGIKLVNKDHPKVIEIWNLVFIQYYRKADGSLKNLPKKHIDTGMGFERLCMVLQGVNSTYETDIFLQLIAKIEKTSSLKFGENKDNDIAFRVISDHIRAVTFSIADGQLPSNSGAGYVIRRILRRSVRYGYTFLNLRQPFMFKLIDVLIKQMSDYYPEIKTQSELIKNVVKEEETSFLKTIDQGLNLLNQIIDKSTSDIVSGELAFELYDTYGFPVDLTDLILKEKNMRLDKLGFEKCLKKQQNRSRVSGKVSTQDWTIVNDAKGQEFVGYDVLKTSVKLLRYRKETSEKNGLRFQLVFDKTPFFAESGGQIGDIGYLESKDGIKTEIIDTKKDNNISVHITRDLPLNLTENFLAVVNSKERFLVECNHTSTHLLHQALRETLGEHVEQKGSSINSRLLRFDFSHFTKLTSNEIFDIESLVNSRIKAGLPFEEERSVPKPEAINKGALALFGEKYGDLVRTVKFGKSIELCGGTHVKNSEKIWHFKIISETAVASGVRRIEAICSDSLKEFYLDNTKKISELRLLLNNSSDLLKSLNAIKEENVLLRKELQSLKIEKAKSLKSEILKEIKMLNGISFLSKEIQMDSNNIKTTCFEIGKDFKNLVLILASRVNDKAILACYVSKELTESHGLSAEEFIKLISKFIDGRGGGQSFFATAGGKNPDGISNALNSAKSIIDAL